MRMKVIYFIAVIGLLSSMVAHLSTFLGINPQDVFPPVWSLHILIFVVWAPALFRGGNSRTKDRKHFWREVISNAPGLDDSHELDFVCLRFL